MKVFRDGKVYVQMFELKELPDYLKVSGENCPFEIFNCLYENKIDYSEKNKYDFVEFDNKDSKKFFLNVPYIIDYKEYKNFDNKSLKAYIKTFEENLKTLSQKDDIYFNKLKLNSLLEYQKYSKKHKKDFPFYQNKTKQKVLFEFK